MWNLQVVQRQDVVAPVRQIYQQLDNPLVDSPLHYIQRLALEVTTGWIVRVQCFQFLDKALQVFFVASVMGNTSYMCCSGLCLHYHYRREAAVANLFSKKSE